VLLAAAAVVAAACGGGPEVPTYEVVPRDFTHRVAAEGFLRASEVTQVKVPSQAPNGARILWRANDGIQVAAGEVVALLDQAELKRRLQLRETNLASAELRRKQTSVEGEVRIDEVASRKEEAGLELEHAERFRRVDQNLYSRREILQSEIDEELARVRQDRAGELQELQRDLAQTELSLIDVDRRRAADEVARARRALNALEVRAPRAGILSWVRNDRGDLPQIGEQVWKNQTLAELPVMSRFGIEAFVVEADVGGIVAGREAEVTVDAHPGLTYRARVSRVDPVAKPRFSGSPVLYFEILLDLETTDLEVMKPGQRVVASILVEELDDALVVPRQALFSEEGLYVVYRDTGHGFERTPVEVSSVARGLAVVASGLDAGSRVALAAPADEAKPGGLRKALAAFMGRA
jgi:multidrug efflux pump subunit AcrA (membrane-fusion protein)